MMITAITIENFKGIRERVRIPIRPITLLFGPNSGGKSTILQAFHYAREILERRNLDCENTPSGGRFVDLGGFSNFVYGRDPRRHVTLGFDVVANINSFPQYWGLHNWSNFESCLSEEERVFITFPMMRLPQSVEVRAEFSIAWSASGLYVAGYSVQFNGEAFATVSSIDTPRMRPLELNFEHPFWKSFLLPPLLKIDAKLENEGELNALSKVIGGEQPLHLGQNDALPDPKDTTGNSFELLYSDFGGHGDCFQIGLVCLDRILAKLIAGPCVLLANELRTFRYLGPFRDSPSREYTPPRFPDNNRWVAGLGAWDALNTASPEFIAEVSGWLSHPNRLDTGYELRSSRVKEIDTDSELWTELRQGRAAKNPETRERRLLDLRTRRRVTLVKAKGEGETRPQDIGVGIAQVLPVVVACCDPQPPITAIEQPELHLHPRLQCELGDLFVAGALGRKSETDEPTLQTEHDGAAVGKIGNVSLRRTFLLETHSEHLILRILRRIRETARGTPHGGVPVTAEDVSVIYIRQEDGQSVPQTIHIDSNGEFVELWPDQFFELDFYERFG